MRPASVGKQVMPSDGNGFAGRETDSAGGGGDRFAGGKRVLPDAVRLENHKKIPVGVIPTGIFGFS